MEEERIRGLIDYLLSEKLEARSEVKLNKVARETGYDENFIERVSRLGLIHIDGVSNVSLEEKGEDFYQNSKLSSLLTQNRRINATLINQEKKSAAVETIFTFSLFIFTFIQVYEIVWSTNLIEGVLRYILSIFLVLVFGLAIFLVGSIGSQNLMEVMNEEVDFKKLGLGEIHLRSSSDR